MRRHHRAIMLGIAAWTAVTVAASATPEASTAEERARIVALSRAFERDVLGPDAGRLATEIQGWWIEVPDLTVTWVRDLLPAEEIGSQVVARALAVQALAAAGVFVIEHPDRASDRRASWVAGLEGVVRAYQRILVKHRELRDPFLDRLADRCAAGTLVEYIDERVGGYR